MRSFTDKCLFYPWNIFRRMSERCLTKVNVVNIYLFIISRLVQSSLKQQHYQKYLADRRIDCVSPHYKFICNCVLSVHRWKSQYTFDISQYNSCSWLKSIIILVSPVITTHAIVYKVVYDGDFGFSYKNR